MARQRASLHETPRLILTGHVCRDPQNPSAGQAALDTQTNSAGVMTQPLTVKSYKVNRICETKGCTTRLSRYNKDTICGACYTAIPLEKLPYKYFAKFR
jgi:hypothetical protein